MRSLRLALLAGAACVLLHGQARAQGSQAQQEPVPAAGETVAAGSAAPEADTAGGDIVVTANRTESLASRTPVALTAITGAGLARAGVTTTSQLADQVPSLVLATSNGGLQITIRGVTNEEATARGDPSAAFLIDEVYIARPQAVEVGLFDINRVEVLRGPQGTLFGRNTTAGLIHIVTNRPNFDFTRSLNVTAGNYSAFQTTAVVNAPLSDQFAMRAAVNYDRRDNFVRQGQRFTGDIDPYKENLAARLQALYRWDTGEIVLRGDYASLGGRPYDILPLFNFFTPTTPDVDPRYIGDDAKDLLRVNAPITWDVFRDNTAWSLGVEISQEVGPLQATYIGSYRQFDRDEADPKISADAVNAYRLEWEGRFKQHSHELRLATTGSGPLRAQVGAYYFREDIVQAFRLNLVANQFFLGNVNVTGDDPLINTSYAFFGQGTYSLLDDLRLTVGARYSHDNKKSLNGFTDLCAQFDCRTTVTRASTNIADVTSSKVTWRVGLDYDLTPTTLLFASVSTGYKAGGFNTGCELGTAPGCTLSPDALYFDPETVLSYEAGVKTALLDRRLRFNLVGFRYDYEDIQLNQLIADCGGGASCSATTNGGKARVTGIEFDGTFALTPLDRFEFGATWLDAHFVEFNPIPTVSLADKPLSKSPDWTLTAGYTHEFPLANGGSIEAGVRTRISDEYEFLVISTRNYYPQPGFSKTDLRVTYNAPDDRWNAGAFVNNLENELPITTVILGTRSAVHTQAPRTFGVRAGVNF